jgi:hypothetical protein
MLLNGACGPRSANLLGEDFLGVSWSEGDFTTAIAEKGTLLAGDAGKRVEILNPFNARRYWQRRIRALELPAC